MRRFSKVASLQVAERDLDDLRTEFRDQISDMRSEIIGAIGRNAPQPKMNSAKAVRTEEERQPQVGEKKNSRGGGCTNQIEYSARTESAQRSDSLKVLNLSDRKQLTFLVAGHQVADELETVTHQSIVSLVVFVAHLQSMGQDVDD